MGYIFESLDQLWRASEETKLIKAEVIETYAQILPIIDDISKYESYWLPLLQFSTSPDNSEALYLFQSGVDLWWQVIQKYQSTTPSLIGLFSNLKGAKFLDTHESVSTVIKIIQFYFYRVQLQSLFQFYENLDSVALIFCYLLESIQKLTKEEQIQLGSLILFLIIHQLIPKIEILLEKILVDVLLSTSEVIIIFFCTPLFSQLCN